MLSRANSHATEQKRGILVEHGYVVVAVDRPEEARNARHASLGERIQDGARQRAWSSRSGWRGER